MDFQLEELNSRFNDGTMKFLVLSFALEHKDNFKSFKVDAICKLVDIFLFWKFQWIRYALFEISARVLLDWCDSSWELLEYVYHFQIISRINRNK